MKKLLGKISVLFLAIAMLFASLFVGTKDKQVNAATTGSISLSTSDTGASAGDTVTVRITASVSDSTTSWASVQIRLYVSDTTLVEFSSLTFVSETTSVTDFSGDFLSAGYYQVSIGDISEGAYPSSSPLVFDVSFTLTSAASSESSVGFYLKQTKSAAALNLFVDGVEEQVSYKSVSISHTSTSTLSIPLSGGGGGGSTQSSDATLSGLSVATDSSVSATKNGLASTFSASTTSYTVYVPDDSSTVTITPTVNDSSASQTITVSSTGATAASSVSSGSGLAVTGFSDGATVKLTVTAEDGTTKVYTLTFDVVSTDVTISNLQVIGTTNSTAYTPTVSGTTYSVTLPTAAGTTGTVSLTLGGSSASATIDGSAYSSSTAYGKGSYSIVVTSEAGNTASYTLTIATQSSGGTTVTGSGITISSSAETVSPNSTFDITVKAHYEDSTTSWAMTQIYLYISDSASIVSYSSYNIVQPASGYTEFMGSSITTKSTGNYYLVSIGDIDEGAVSNSTDIIITATFKMSSEATEGSTVDFYLKPGKSSTVMEFHDGTLINTGAQVSHEETNPLQVTVGAAASSEKNITSLKVGTSTSSITTTLTESTGTFAHTVTTNATKVYTTATVSSGASYAVSTSSTGASASKGTSYDTITLSSTGTTVVTYKVTAENGTTKSYTLTIKSAYAALSGLTVTTNSSSSATKNGLSGSFASSTTSYTAYVPDDATTVSVKPTVASGFGINTTIAVTASGCSASSSVTSGSTLSVTNVTEGAFVKLTVTAADGSTTAVYTITFDVVSVDTSLSDVSITSKSTGTNYNYTSLVSNVYSFEMPSSAGTTATISLTAHANATVTIDGSAYSSSTSYALGNHTVVVTSEAGNTKTYTITISQGKDNNANLSTFTSTVTLDQTISASTYTYTATVPYATSSVTITATPESSAATVTGTGTISLSVGSNKIEFYVVAEDGTAGNTYTLNITRSAADTDATLSDLKIDGTTVDGFSASVTSYTVYVNHKSTASVTIAATANSSVATVSGDTGNQSVSKGSQTFSILVTAQSGATKTYKVTVIYGEANANLTNITIAEVGASDFTFSAGTETYSFTVPYEVTELTVSATKSGTYSTISGTGTFALAVGSSNKITVYATAENGTVGTKYVITVTRSSADTDATLSDLKIDGTTIDGFSASVTSYTVYVDHKSTASVTIAATATKSTSTVSGDTGNQSVTTGSQTFSVIATAQSGATKTYKVTIVYGEADAGLTNIAIAEVGASDFTFNAGTSTYSFTVPFEVTELTVSATKSGTYSTISGTGTIALTVGSSNKITVYATAENGTVGTKYVITVTRSAAVTDASLNDLKIDGTTISGFSSSKTSYNYSVDHDTSSIVIAATASESTSTVTGKIGTVSLNVGSNNLQIVVTSQAGTTTVYTVNVTRAETLNGITNISVTNVSDFAFNAETTTYNYTVGYSVSSVSVSATSDGKYATITGAKDYVLTAGSKTTITVYATSEAGVKGQVYTINITRETAKSDSTLSNLTLDGTQVTDFASSTTSYTVYVDHDTTSLAVVGTPNDSNATVSVTGNYNALDIGKNTITVKVTAEDSSSTSYIVTVIRGEDENTITNITFGNIDSSLFTFETATTTYEFTVPNSIQYLDAPTVTYTGDYTVITGASASIALQAGQENTFTIYATSEIGNKGTVYTFKVTREADQTVDLSITNISVTGSDSVNYLADYDPDTLTYSITVPYSVTSVAVAADIPTGAGSTLVGVNSYALTAGDSRVVTVYTTAPNGDEGSHYEITITRDSGSQNNKLSTLTIDGVEVEGFASSTYTYSIRVERSVEGVTIGAVALDSNATISGTGYKALSNGANNIEIVVTSQTGLKQKYTLKITKAEDIYEITNITVSNSDYVFDPSITSTTINLAYSERIVTIDAEVAGATYATLTGTGTKSLPVGTTNVTVYATSDYGTESVKYVLTFVVEAANGDSTLKDLQVTLGSDTTNMITSFSPSTLSYSIIIDDETVSFTSVVITAIANNNKAEVSGAGTQPLNSGTITTENVVVLTVKVKAEDGSSTEYKILISRKAVSLSGDNTIYSISVVGNDGVTYFGSEYVNTTYSYTISDPLPYSVNTVIVSATTAAGATLTGTGTYSFDSNNQVVISVYSTSEDGTVGNTYTITLSKNTADSTTTLSAIKIDGSVISGFDPNKFTYSLKVLNQTASINFAATATNPSAAVTVSVDGLIHGAAVINLTEGETTNISVLVTAQDGSTQVYTVSIKRASADGTLADLYVVDHGFEDEKGNDIVFSDEIITYFVHVTYDTSTIEIYAESLDPTMEIRGTGVKALSVGRNQFKVSVIPSGDGGVSYYTIVVIRYAAASDVIVIDEVKIEGIDEPEVDKQSFTLTKVDVTSDVDSFDADISFITGEYEDDPTYRFLNTKLNFGENTVIVEITATDQTTIKYHAIEVYREYVGVNSASIEEIEEFAKDYKQTNSLYTYKVTSAVGQLTFDFTLDTQNATFEVANLTTSANSSDKKTANDGTVAHATELVDGVNDIAVTIKYDNDVSTVIYLSVYKEAEGESTENSTLTLIITLIIAGVSVVIAFIAFFIFNRRRK